MIDYWFQFVPNRYQFCLQYLKKHIFILNTFAFICFRLTQGAQICEICQSAHQATLMITGVAPKRRTPKPASWAVQMYPNACRLLANPDCERGLHRSLLHDVRESPPQASKLSCCAKLRLSQTAVLPYCQYWYQYLSTGAWTRAWSWRRASLDGHDLSSYLSRNVPECGSLPWTKVTVSSSRQRSGWP